MEFDSRIIGTLLQTHDVMSLSLTKPDGFSYRPGQYCLVSIPGEFAGQSRPFTFTSSPTDDHLGLAIKRMGLFTTALHALKSGDTLHISAPFGEQLSFDESIKDDVVFVAGGSGITPFMAALRYAGAKHLKNRLILFYSNRSEKDIIFRADLDQMDGKTVKIVNTLTDEMPVSWKGERGFISEKLIRKYVPSPSRWLWYICGPPPMIDAMKKILSEMGVPQERLRIEPWQIPGKVHR
jgi:glycine betaine catabolism B